MITHTWSSLIRLVKHWFNVRNGLLLISVIFVFTTPSPVHLAPTWSLIVLIIRLFPTPPSPFSAYSSPSSTTKWIPRLSRWESMAHCRRLLSRLLLLVLVVCCASMLQPSTIKLRGGWGVLLLTVAIVVRGLAVTAGRRLGSPRLLRFNRRARITGAWRLNKNNCRLRINQSINQLCDQSILQSISHSMV